MYGIRMKALRDRRGEDGTQFAGWLNKLLERKYDRQKISRWENDAERLPVDVQRILFDEEDRLEMRTYDATVLAVANQKGGVAKTVTSVDMAYQILQTGRRVLVIDADFQTNASAYLGKTVKVQKHLMEQKSTLYHVLIGEADIGSIIQKTDHPGLDVIVSSVLLANIDAELAVDPTSGGATVLDRKMAPLLRRYDAIIIDCPPNLGVMTLAGLTAADYVLVVTETAPNSIIGARWLIDNTVGNIRSKLNPKLEVLGVLPTKFRAAETADQESLSEIHTIWDGVLQVFDAIAFRATVKKAEGAMVIPTWADPKLPSVQIYQAIVQRLFEVKNKGERKHG